MTYEPTEDPDKYPDHQLTPLKGGRYTDIFHGPLGTDVGDLYCDLEPYFEGEKPAIINHSGWLASEEQARQLEAGAHIRLSVWSHPIPPLAVSVEPPVCDHCDRPMVWDSDDCGYYCPDVQASGRAADPKAAAEKEVRDSFSPADEDG